MQRRSEKENAIPNEELLKYAIQEEINRKVEEEKDLEKGGKYHHVSGS